MSATIGTRLFTLFHGRFVGRDEFGNRYFEARRAATHARRRRWVMYAGVVEPSKVPAHWHGWLHYTLEAPIPEAAKKYRWQKPHQPNLTGTTGRYLPEGHISKSGQRAPSSADYEAWQPK
jgi:NADH:ubiquinone oxidoreductase subunit